MRAFFMSRLFSVEESSYIYFITLKQIIMKTTKEVEQRLGVKCTDNTATYFEEGVQLAGLSDRMKFFAIDDPISNPKGYGFELVVDLKKETFKFVHDSCAIKIKETNLSDLDQKVYEEAVRLINE